MDQQILMRGFTGAIFIAVLCIACDPYANPRYASVSFSSDTLFFDTVFTSIGSATMEVRVHNNTDRPLLLDRIWLAGGDDSPFRININGYPSGPLSDLTIAAGDSIFLFVDVNVDPTGGDLPILVTDSVMFSSGQFMSKIILEAWGQDIRIIETDTLGDTSWDKGRPWVVYGSVLVDTNATLTVNPGAMIYFHRGARMTVAGTLVASGTAEDPVIFASDRMTDEYENIPGQWEGITFRACSGTNMLRHTVVRNAVIALDVSGSISSGRPSLQLESVSVIHNSVNSLSACYADVNASNSLFANTGFSTVSITNGSEAQFTHCTVANSWRYNIRSNPSFFIGKGPDEAAVLPLVSVFNSVVTGDLGNELTVEAPPADLPGSILFDSSFVEIDIPSCAWWNESCFNGVIIKRNPGFISERDFDFRPDTLSPLCDVAGHVRAALFPVDIRNKPRPAFSGPDMGAFERQPGEKRE